MLRCYTARLNKWTWKVYHYKIHLNEVKTPLSNPKSLKNVLIIKFIKDPKINGNWKKCHQNGQKLQLQWKKKIDYSEN